ncbi:MAG TPA: hypothetical protein VGS41_03135, partial [Chthonomonadales bacterium]|nr:hypothetical protein [Chthonomonadales bacterium]
LLTPDSIRNEVERLEVRYLANPYGNLLYGLVTDFADAIAEQMPEDRERLEIAAAAIEALNAQYGAGHFYLFHRKRTWSDSEQRWIGWERKRGKLEELNRALCDPSQSGLDELLHVGEAANLKGIRYVITLDSDTQLPRDTGRKLVETMAHPLVRAVLSEDGCKVVRGYAILQPRVATSLPSATATLFSRIFTDPTGIDPYSRRVSDVYQDLMGEASYHGKGIYDLRVFHTLLNGRFPEAHLLSHDLIEGAHTMVGFASDIELYDLFPSTYASYIRRQHRWVRGDWQIADWLLPTVPGGAGRRQPNPLSALNRWKILDNLRRSLVPAAATAMLLVAWITEPHGASSDLLLPRADWAAVVAGTMLLLPALLSFLSQLARANRVQPAAWAGVGSGLLRAAVTASLIPHQALSNLDAIARVLHRRTISHRKLLEWETAAEAQRKGRGRFARFLWSMAWLPICAALVALALSLRPGKGGEPAADPFLALWIISPLTVAWLSRRSLVLGARPLTGGDAQTLRQIARLTWRFFDDFVGPQTNWLPPDNYQAFLRVEVAMRTSPTNIGLYLLSLLTAHDFGFLTLDAFLQRLSEALQTMTKLERYEG